MPFLVKFHEMDNCARSDFFPPGPVSLGCFVCDLYVSFFKKNSLLRNSIFLNRGAITCIFFFQSRTIRQLDICGPCLPSEYKILIAEANLLLLRYNSQTKCMWQPSFRSSYFQVKHQTTSQIFCTLLSILSSWPMEFFF